MRLQLKWRHQFQFAGYYAAIEKGFFRDEGLAVELVEGNPGVTPSQVILDGQADFAVDAPSIVIQRQLGAPLVALAAIFQHSPTVLLTRRDSGILTPQDLRGKRVMFTQLTDPECLAMLSNEHVTLDSLTIMPHNWSIDDLIMGKVDAQTAYLTNEPYQMLLRGVEPGVINPRSYGIDFYGDCLVATEAKVREDPRLVEAFLRGVQRGWRYAMENREEIARLILAKYTPRKSLDALLYEARVMDELIKPEFVAIGHMNPERWRHIADVYVRLGMMPRNYSLEGFFFSDIIEEAARREQRIFRNVLSVLAGAVLLAAGFGIAQWRFGKRLARQVRERTEALAASEETFRSIVESSPVGMLFFRKGDDGLYRLTGGNPAADRLTARPHREYLGRALAETFPDLEATDATAVETSQRSVETRSDEGLFRGLYDVHLFHTGPEALALIFQEVSERRRMMEMLIQTEKMMSLGGLAAGMAHEINNPLGGIIQSAQVVLSRLTRDSEVNRQAAMAAGCEMEAVRSFLTARDILFMVQAMRDSALRAAQIVGSMLEFSRAGDVSLSPLSLPAVLDKAVELCSTDFDHQNKYDFKGVRILREYEAHLPPALGNRTQIQQVFMNLMANAAHAMAGQGDPEIVLRARRDGDMARVEIEDNGPGMTEDVRRKVFEPFFTTKGVGEGTGLGLSLSYFIITNNHNGTIEVESDPGRGSRFIIRLPLA
ncbi:ABC transporter substrate-binding protein [Fundidesulfovibrio magnetotacticus]|uniref:ABC transporter substrate-binding protein n=1 Tax=Fundidesulfovibrio magnetotacticus TaxID=2730080 RepID=UPI0015637897|nr:ABC transporter substrate-binding protein [Fundidesulfovibrio magnetotacticus]